jgi:zinc protease
MSTLDRTTPPAGGAMRSFDFPAVERFDLADGLDLRVARLPRLPVASVNLFIRSGESLLQEGRAGLSVLTADALDGGTRSRSGAELAEALERLGARFGANAGWEGTSVDLYCLADRLPEALALMAEVVRTPSFPADEVARAKEQHLAELRQRLMDPASLASDVALSRYFEAPVPYARPLDGTVESVTPLTREDLLEHAARTYRPGSGGLVVVGDVDAREMRSLAEEHLGSWEPQKGAAGGFDVTAQSTERRVLVVDRPGSVQSEIRVGHVGAARSTPDYFALSIANMVLGGTFTSRLNLNLRERHGFTYGVRSHFSFRGRPGPFQVSTSVGTDVTSDAVREIVSELEAFAEGGATDDEVAAARDFAAGIFGLQLETTSQIASRLTHLVMFGLPDAYYHEYRDRVRAVTTIEVAEAARRHVRPSEAQIVVVGDADRVVGPLNELALGTLEVRTVQREVRGETS